MSQPHCTSKSCSCAVQDTRDALSRELTMLTRHLALLALQQQRLRLLAAHLRAMLSHLDYADHPERSPHD